MKVTIEVKSDGGREYANLTVERVSFGTSGTAEARRLLDDAVTEARAALDGRPTR